MLTTAGEGEAQHQHPPSHTHHQQGLVLPQAGPGVAQGGDHLTQHVEVTWNITRAECYGLKCPEDGAQSEADQHQEEEDRPELGTGYSGHNLQVQC